MIARNAKDFAVHRKQENKETARKMEATHPVGDQDTEYIKNFKS